VEEEEDVVDEEDATLAEGVVVDEPLVARIEGVPWNHG
jgi:hypothetical protein